MKKVIIILAAVSMASCSTSEKFEFTTYKAHGYSVSVMWDKRNVQNPKAYNAKTLAPVTDSEQWIINECLAGNGQELAKN